jgi:hypothetical protein
MTSRSATGQRETGRDGSPRTLKFPHLSSHNLQNRMTRKQTASAKN